MNSIPSYNRWKTFSLTKYKNSTFYGSDLSFFLTYAYTIVYNVGFYNTIEL